MPAGSRIRGNNAFGVTTDNPLTSGATTFNSNQLTFLPAVIGNHAVITLDPIRQFGDPEIVVVTAHTAAATVATITRGTYGTLARQHPAGTTWAHASINEDHVSILTSGTRPSDPYNGEIIYETNTSRWASWNGSIWLPAPSNPPACRVTSSVAQTGFAHATELPLLFDTEIYDTDNMHSTVSNTDRITFNTAGLYIVSWAFRFPTDTDYTYTYGFVRDNIATDYSVIGMGTNTTGITPFLAGSFVSRFTAGQWIQVRGAQFNTNSGTNNPSATANYFSAAWIGSGT